MPVEKKLQPVLLIDVVFFTSPSYYRVTYFHSAFLQIMLITHIREAHCCGPGEEGHDASLSESRWSHFQLCRVFHFIAFIPCIAYVFWARLSLPSPYRVLVIKISENDINDELAVGVQYQHERYLAMMRENFLDGLPIFRGW